MKKILAFFIIGMLLFMFAACGNKADNTASPAPESSTSTENQEEPSVSEEPSLSEAISQSEDSQSESSDASEADTEESKILVAYFSSAGNIVTDEAVSGNIGHGNTKRVAELIQGQVGGDLFFIETVEKYPANYREAIGVAMQELRDDIRPTLATHVEDMDEYNVVFLGYPNWWGKLPQAVVTFVEEYDFSGKTVIPFCTYEDSGVGSSIQDLEEMLTNTTLLKEYSVAEKNLDEAEEDVRQWLLELDLLSE